MRKIITLWLWLYPISLIIISFFLMKERVIDLAIFLTGVFLLLTGGFLAGWLSHYKKYWFKTVEELEVLKQKEKEQLDNLIMYHQMLGAHEGIKLWKEKKQKEKNETGDEQILS